MPARAIDLAWLEKLRMPVPGISKVPYLAFDRHQHSRWVDVKGGICEITVEEIVPVLVGGHPLHDLTAGRVVEQFAGVVMRNPGCEFLQRRVDQSTLRIDREGNLTTFDLRHTRPLQRD